MVIKEKWGYKEVPKEPRGYYSLQGHYMFRNSRTGEFASMTGYSTVTRHKCRGKELQILREQAIDFARDNIPYLIDVPGKWILEDILYEVWLKW